MPLSFQAPLVISSERSESRNLLPYGPEGDHFPSCTISIVLGHTACIILNVNKHYFCIVEIKQYICTKKRYNYDRAETHTAANNGRAGR